MSLLQSLLFLLLPFSILSLLPKGTIRHELTFQLESRLTCFWENFTQNDRLRVSVVSMEDKKLLLQVSNKLNQINFLSLDLDSQSHLSSHFIIRHKYLK